MTFARDRYQQMEYRRCGRSGLKLPEISLGFWQVLGEPGNEQLCRDVMFRAFDRGVTHFDFANNYGPPFGNAEQVAGKWLKEMPRDELVISTKAGYNMWPGPYGEWGSRKYLIASCDQSLKRLGLDYVDIFYSHRFDPETPLEETLGALDTIVGSGKALYAGVSSYNAEQFRDAMRIVRENHLTRILIHQPVMNMLVRVHEKHLLPETEKEGVGVIAFCPLAQGILTDRYRAGIPEDSRRGKLGDAGRKWYDDLAAKGVWEKIAKLAKLSDKRGQSLAQMALVWLLRDPRVTSVLIGVSRMEQLDQNLDALKNKGFSEEELNTIEEIVGPGQVPFW
ncbi:aldo/keto reductase [Candidatus Sumerlaeota bacterium]|nr:aldo/keto reductase [Candidatus Sumerlaeota bacterium]